MVGRGESSCCSALLVVPFWVGCVFFGVTCLWSFPSCAVEGFLLDSRANRPRAPTQEPADRVRSSGPVVTEGTDPLTGTGHRPKEQLPFSASTPCTDECVLTPTSPTACRRSFGYDDSVSPLRLVTAGLLLLFLNTVLAGNALVSGRRSAVMDGHFWTHHTKHCILPGKVSYT